MTNILETEHTIASFKREKELVIITRTVPSETTEELYKKEAILWAEIYPKYKPKYQLVDMTKNHFVVNEEQQKWLNINVLSPALKAGLEYVAFVVSPTLFTKLSHEIIMEEKIGANFKIQYFDNIEKALNWLRNS